MWYHSYLVRHRFQKSIKLELCKPTVQIRILLPIRILIWLYYHTKPTERFQISTIPCRHLDKLCVLNSNESTPWQYPAPIIVKTNNITKSTQISLNLLYDFLVINDNDIVYRSYHT